MKVSAPTHAARPRLSTVMGVTALLIAATFSSVLEYHLPCMPAMNRTNKLQEPQVAIPTGTYRQTNLVSDLPG